jgi:hypothetical protein
MDHVERMEMERTRREFARERSVLRARRARERAEDVARALDAWEGEHAIPEGAFGEEPRLPGPVLPLGMRNGTRAL